MSRGGCSWPLRPRRTSDGPVSHRLSRRSQQSDSDVNSGSFETLTFSAPEPPVWPRSRRRIEVIINPPCWDRAEICRDELLKRLWKRVISSAAVKDLLGWALFCSSPQRLLRSERSAEAGPLFGDFAQVFLCITTFMWVHLYLFCIKMKGHLC